MTKNAISAIVRTAPIFLLNSHIPDVAAKREDTNMPMTVPIDDGPADTDQLTAIAQKLTKPTTA